MQPARRTTSWSSARCQLFSWVGGARIIRSQILALRETEFILAARMLGASTPRIMFRHLLPNVSNIIIVSLSLGLAGIAGSEIVLTWFGVGIQPPHPSFGAMIFEASQRPHRQPVSSPAGRSREPSWPACSSPSTSSATP